MLFSHRAKQEICRNMTARDKRRACLYGIFLFCKYFGDDEIRFRTGCRASSEFFEQMIRDFFGSTLDMSFEESVTLEKTAFTHYIKDTLPVISFIGGTRELIDPAVVSENPEAFLAGVFLACGSVSNPKKEYHFEFTLYNAALESAFSEFLFSCGIYMRRSVRKGAVILYLKDSEAIEEALTFVGASKSALEIMLVKIEKNDNNHINRITNCDNANIDKTISASCRQLEAIEKIIASGGLVLLSPELSELALLRRENPEMSLKELGESLSKPLGRSGVSHRMRKLLFIAENL